MKKFLLVLILILIVASCLFPPWRWIYKFPGSNIKKYEPLGYRFITNPPTLRTDVKADTIDFSRLGIQLGLLLFLGSCIVFSKYIFPKTQPKPKPAPSDEPLPKKKRKWITKTLLCLLVLIFLAYGTVMTILYYEAEQDWTICHNTWYEKYNKLYKEYEGMTKAAKSPKVRSTGINVALLHDLEGSALVERLLSVYDGDTFHCDLKYPPAIGYKDIPIRIRGIDAPEIQGGTTETKQLSQKAKEFTKSVLENAKEIKLENIERDKYFRIIADVNVDGHDLATMLLQQSLAKPYTDGKN